MLDEHPRKQLNYIITRYGRSICDDLNRCKGLLKDLCPKNKLEVNLLITALKEKVVDELLKLPKNIPVELTLKRLAQRLHENLGIIEKFAIWAVESWALALNIIQKPSNYSTLKKMTVTVPQDYLLFKKQRYSNNSKVSICTNF